MHVVGDPEGVTALKALATTHREYLKFLLNEAQTSSNHAAVFKTDDGTRWEVVFHPESGDVEVRHPRTNASTMAPPPKAPDE
jgi:hypothetical protein